MVYKPTNIYGGPHPVSYTYGSPESRSATIYSTDMDLSENGIYTQIFAILVGQKND